MWPPGFRGLFTAREQHPIQPLPPVNNPPSTQHSNDKWPAYFSNPELKAFSPFYQTYNDRLRDDWKGVDDPPEGDEGEVSNTEERQDEDDHGGIYQEDESPAGVFMKKRLYTRPSETSENWHPGAHILCKFCHDITFKDLEKADEEPDNRAYIENGSRTGDFQQSAGPLSSRQLNNELRKPRYNVQTSHSLSDTSIHTSLEQRRICFLNITPRMAAVLMDTTIINEAPAVQDLLYRHIGRASFLGVTVPTRGVKTFTFHLSIPSYSLLRGPRVTDDRRLGTKFLRATLSIPNLGDFQEAHTSVILTGASDWIWTAIALVDNVRAAAFSPSDVDEDLPPGCRRDHIAGVDVFHQHAESNARPYFLWVWKERLEQILRDWTEVADTIISAVDERNLDDLAIMDRVCDDEKIKQLDASIAEVAHWATQFDQMKIKLRSMLYDWDSFRQSDGGEKYFRDESMPLGNVLGTRDSFGALKELYSRAALLLKQLDDVTSTLDGKLNRLHFAHEISTKIMADLQAQRVATTQEETAMVQKEAAMVQKEAAKSARRASITTIFFLPAMVAFTLFSMEKTAIPVAVNRGSLLIILGVIGVMTVVLFNCVDFITAKGDDLGRLAGRILGLLSFRSLQQTEDMDMV